MKICFVSIDVEEDPCRDNHLTFRGVENLPKILAIFKKYNISATLFVTGETLIRYQEDFTRYANDFEIASHNFQHQPLFNLSESQRVEQLEKFVSSYRQIFQKNPLGFRAPRHSIDNLQIDLLEKQGFQYDSSVMASYLPGLKYAGYQGPAPQEPYFPDLQNYRHKGQRKILEIPVTNLWGGISLYGTWVRYFPASFFACLLKIKKPKLLSLAMHSWDGVAFEGRLSKNSGQVFLQRLEKIIKLLKNNGYQFSSGQQIYGKSVAGKL